MNNYTDILFEISRSGRTAYSLPKRDVPTISLEEKFSKVHLREEAAKLPEISELQLMRHYTALSNKNFGIENGFYPLGSCTMKYNPKINEDVARYRGFTNIHPLQTTRTLQGALRLMYELQEDLKVVSGMDAISLQPAAGAQGEWAGLMIIKAYHEKNEDLKTRRKILVPDSAHGTNPASAVIAGFDVVEIPSNEDGTVDLAALKQAVGEDTAGLMLTNPNTLGIFEKDILEMADIIHGVGGLLYYDGANLNAIMGITTPGAMGFDIVHLNLHKSFSTPHGGGGPGSGPVGVKAYLEPYLPIPRIEKTGNGFELNSNYPLSIGRVKGYFGNFGVNVRAYTYIRTMGARGLRKASESAVLHANYLRKRLEPYYDSPYKQVSKHEFVLSGNRQKKLGVRTVDIAKRLLDFGYYAPTIYFPLIVEECLMIEPTETESKETLDEFADAMIQIAKEVEDTPELVTGAPHHTSVKRLDEVTAARKPIVRFE
ncbi:aminomethyl-transferring glycine dehydrogenase subunit GcvPB [Desemzia sp. RIT804]|uniref:aminomethyl-transferring glycine dehydrogenase subunit GcvPB n=1 Tax=Desemzia sp. RIT 804 TaxID=2810209 RepID=UPI00194E3775|nr:aminomethyl-transferring glycine dehydrogenase subunit GcvPB [Desemzia sp. RIT 804]MBM6613307.1 aminomethyl-transferring glycine dehydrogenase subunit GcvPB [Desemzia sp. RIT 804]